MTGIWFSGTRAPTRLGSSLAAVDCCVSMPMISHRRGP
jgi:hypothetical protein